MTIEAFLKQFVDDYLLKDLASMAAVTPPPGQTGACGFSMVLVTLAGCEMLGSVTYPKAFDPYDGAKHFDHFWKQGLYPADPSRAELSPTIYKLVRHGLAHAFVTKPMILVTKNKGTKNHLRQNAGVLTVDCLALADDFRAAYERYVRPQLQVLSQRAALQQQLEIILDRSTKDSDEHVIRIGSAPPSDPTEAQFFVPSGQYLADSMLPPEDGPAHHIIPSGIGMVNSPTVPPVRKPKP